MANGPASFSTQANALLRKNLTFQKRNIWTNVRLVCFPIFICLLLVTLQTLIDSLLDRPDYRCGCSCVDNNGDGKCEITCGLEHSNPEQAVFCPVPNPPKWPPLLQIPYNSYRAVRTNSWTDLPNKSCRTTGSCPATILFTGNNQSFGQILAGNMMETSVSLNASDVIGGLANFILGSETETVLTYILEPAFTVGHPVYNLQRQCTSNSSLSVAIQALNSSVNIDLRCLESLHLWRNSSSEINDELYKGYFKGNSEGSINEIVAAYDVLNSNKNNFNVSIWYNSTYESINGTSSKNFLRVPRSVNLASNAYLQFLQGSGTKLLFEFVKEMPQFGRKYSIDLSSLLGTLFFTWVVLQLFPVVLQSLVYEKQQKLRIMMKMHGLGDGPYWMISYAYFLIISLIYILCFVVFGSLIGLKFFTLNDYSIQFVFYFVYVNLQVSMAFLIAAMFSNVKTATVLGYICVFGTGLLGSFLFQVFLEDLSFPRVWITVMELFPGFCLYRGLYEFGEYSQNGVSMGTHGMQWGDFSHSGISEVMIIMLVEWFVVLFAAYYIDQVASSGSARSPLFFLKIFRKRSPSFRKPSLQRKRSKVFVDIEKPDVSQEREKVEQLLLEPSTSHAIICDNLKKVYPGKDGNPEKFAVRGLALALPRGECFGMLGPNGAGKTSFINMMIGLTKPTSGTAFVEGLDIRSYMDRIYTSMGVCPQHDLLWETLTGREHLLFYGRLKNLKGSALTRAVEESLKSLNLFHGGVADKQAGKYSGGMKRRLSVAISLIGDPKVVYMDEPSTGLDPFSRNSLWNVVKRAKQDRAIILTTHSMEEAEALCDRLGIFVDGSLQCIGNAKELKGRYGGSYVFTMATSSNNEEEVDKLVQRLSPSAKKIYQISGTQKFELPKHEVRIADVFLAVENAKSRFTVFAWGLADTTLEDVFIKVARGAQAFNVLS
ncbi:ABC_tran domain-containing protein/ABC2_membrane_3 domain-containing protein [Cephalotus follicularis]|uniref:ABC_tran domain-containing protein/ABC2_membrane_3 domain-containing protein n=1 Tax=Cephalotus follicularis TaxID=3775 RepID=A0A1Q3C9Y0_CEPFO|nr:ABC_tran domain-containing protein/ABC2_membrane_3 domain-containing protein [Cephalotus follicularis]